MNEQLDLAMLVRDVPDFPTEGIMFKDVMPLIADPVAFRETVDRLAAWSGPGPRISSSARRLAASSSVARSRMRSAAVS